MALELLSPMINNCKDILLSHCLEFKKQTFKLNHKALEKVFNYTPVEKKIRNSELRKNV